MAGMDSLFSALDAMEACLANNSAEARRRAQFKNTMLGLIAVARPWPIHDAQERYIKLELEASLDFSS